MDALRPTAYQTEKWNTVKEQQFNRHHGEVKHKFNPGQQVFAKDYSNRK